MKRTHFYNNKRGKLFYLLFASLLLISLFTSILLHSSVQVNAAAGDGQASTYGIPVTNGRPALTAAQIKSADWIDANQIVITFQNDLKATFYPLDSGSGDTALQKQRARGIIGSGKIVYSSKDIGCDAFIQFILPSKINNFSLVPLKSGEISIAFKPSAAGECVNPSNPLQYANFLHPELSVAYFKWADSGTIVTVDGATQNGSFTRAENTNYFFKDAEGTSITCRDKLYVNPNDNTVTFWELDTKYDGNPPALSETTGTNCKYNTDGGAFPISNVAMALAGAENATKPAGTGDKGTLSSVGGDEPPTCESSGFSLSWLFCGIVNALAQATDAIHDNMLVPLLQNPSIDPNNSSTPVYKVWTSFRNIANILLLFGLLFVVFGQSLGMDAYTAKKMMPKILVATILINTSYYILSIANDITAILGGGISALIRAPFDLNGMGFSFSGVNGALGLSTILGVGGAAWLVGGGASGGLVLIGSFLFSFILMPVFLALLGAAGVLIFRRGLLLLLIMISPVAFALLAIPGGDKYFKKYRELLISTLMVYPLFEAIWAISQVLAVTINEANGKDSIIGLIATLIALFLPLFLIPFAFKLAGGVLATVGALANDRSKGLIDGRQKKSRERMAHRMHAMGEGHTFRETGSAKSRARKEKANETIEKLAALKKKGAGNVFYGAGGMRGLRDNGLKGTLQRVNSQGETLASLNSDAGLEKFMESHPEVAQLLQDDALNAASRYNTATEIAAELKRFDPGRFNDDSPENSERMRKAVEGIMTMQSDAPAGTLARARLRIMAKTGTGYQTPEGEFDASLALQDINRVYKNDRMGAGRAVASMRGSLLQSGQIAGAAGFATWAQTADQLYDGKITDGEADQIIMDGAIDAAQPGQYAYMKPSSAKAAGRAHARRLQVIAGEVNKTEAEVIQLEQSGADQATIGAAKAKLTNLQGDLAASSAAASSLLESISMQASPQIASAFANSMMDAKLDVVLTQPGELRAVVPVIYEGPQPNGQILSVSQGTIPQLPGLNDVQVKINREQQNQAQQQVPQQAQQVDVTIDTPGYKPGATTTVNTQRTNRTVKTIRDLIEVMPTLNVKDNNGNAINDQYKNRRRDGGYNPYDAARANQQDPNTGIPTEPPQMPGI